MPTALITGGHAGIGYEAAKQLASRSHYNMVLAGRSAERMKAAAQQLRTAYGVKVSTLMLDTSSLASIRGAVSNFLVMLDGGEVDAFQALLCNAGGRFEPLTYSIDGFETTFATNCLGHFLLIELLTDRLANNGRIVFTASGTHDPDTTDGKMVGIVAEPDATVLARTHLILVMTATSSAEGIPSKNLEDHRDGPTLLREVALRHATTKQHAPIHKQHYD